MYLTENILVLHIVRFVFKYTVYLYKIIFLLTWLTKYTCL